MTRSRFFLFGAAIVLMIAVAAYLGARQAGTDAPPGPMDLSLEKLRARNPRLTFSQAGSGPHAFWVTDPAKEKTAILPWQQSEDALVEFAACTDLPKKLLYPKQSAGPVCLRISNEDGVLSAFSFHAPDLLLYDVVAFYDDGSNSSAIRGNTHEQTGRYETLPDGTPVFRYSYFFFINPRGGGQPGGLAGFVGYKKEKGQN